MFDEVWQGVVGRRGPSATGRLEGFAAWRISGQTFPGMTRAPGRTVAGRIWFDVTPDELAKLDAFESGIYERERVLVLTSTGQQLECWTYLVRPDSVGLLLPEPWDREEFQRLHLPTFLRE